MQTEELALGKKAYTFSILTGGLEKRISLDVGIGWRSEHRWENKLLPSSSYFL